MGYDAQEEPNIDKRHSIPLNVQRFKVLIVRLVRFSSTPPPRVYDIDCFDSSIRLCKPFKIIKTFQT